jgi:toxin ParE1/3/4
MSSHPHRLDLTDVARQDLRDILRSTRARWGSRQGDAYQRQLTDAFERLLRFPDLGRRADRFAPNLRSHTVGQHVIYYQTSESVVTVLRLLHQKMDADAELGDDTA